MTLWLIFTVLLLAALGFVVLPLYRHSKRLTGPMIAAITLTVALSAALYYRVGAPDVPSGPGEQPNPHAMVASLAERLEREPNDVEGWLLLARSYETLEQYEPAAAAYEKVLELQPDHPTALFYGGYIAAGRGEMNLAADRWELILRNEAAPEDVRDAIQRQIDIWRGDAPRSPSLATVTPEQGEAIVEASVSLSDEAAASIPADTTVFLIARDPAQPSPPIAVVRRRLTGLPLVVSIGDRDAMVPGRNLSAFDEFELLARVSVSGGPIAQAGDWYGVVTIENGRDTNVDIVIDTEVR